MSQTKKQQVEIGSTAHITHFTAEHVVVPSKHSYAHVTAALEARVGVYGNWGVIPYQLAAMNASWEQVAQTLQVLIGTSGFTALVKMDVGIFLSLAGKPKRIMRYAIGNPVLGVPIHEAEMGLYAPLQLLVYEDYEGRTFVAYDRLASLVSQYHNEEVTSIAQLFDHQLDALARAVTESGQESEKQQVETGSTAHITHFTVEHVVVPSKHSYAHVMAALEARVGVYGSWEVIPYQLAAMNASWEQVAQTLQVLMGTSGFAPFVRMEQGIFLSLAGKPKRSVRYMLGNPVLDLPAIEQVPEMGLYALLQLLVYEDYEGRTFVAYDRLASLVSQYHNEEVTSVAQLFDHQLDALARAVTESGPESEKQQVETGSTPHITHFTVEHVVVPSKHSHAHVMAALEARVGVYGNWEVIPYQLAAMNASWEQVAQTLQVLIGTSDFTAFAKMDPGTLLSLAGRPKRIMRYTIGNPLLGHPAIEHEAEMGLYLPPQLLVYEDYEGRTFVAYDRLTSLVSQYHNEEVTSVAQLLDHKLDALARAVTESGQESEKQQVETGSAPYITHFTAEHVVVPSKHSYAHVVAALEARVGVYGSWEVIPYQLAAMNPPWEQVAQTIQTLIGTSGFTTFVRMEQGIFLSLTGKPKRIKRYMLGDPVLGAPAFEHEPEIGLYALLQLLVYEDYEGRTFVAYDRLASLVSQYHNEEVTSIAQLFDHKLDALARAVTASGQETLSEH